MYPEPDERCREISQRLIYLNRYVTVALAVLFGTTALILQRIDDDRRQKQQHQAVMDDAVQAVDVVGEKLASLHAEFANALRRADISKKALLHLSADDRHVFEHAPDALLPKSGPAVQSALIGSATVRLRNLAAADDGYRNAEIIFQEAVAHAYEYIQLRAARDAKVDALQAVSREKSFPSPFGDINLDPEVALVYLSILAAGAYLFLVMAKRRAIALVPGAKGSATIVPPLWLYTADDSCRQMLGWRPGEDSSRLATAAAVHVTWIALSLGLACATFYTNAHRSIAVLPHAVVAAIIVAINALALVGCFNELFPAGAGELTPAGQVRRSLLAMLIASAAGAPLVLLLRDRSGQKRAMAAPVIPSQLVQNNKSGVLHHGRVCASHLREARYLSAPVPGPNNVHQGYEVAIALATAADVETQLRAIGADRNLTCRKKKEQQAVHLEALAVTLKDALDAQPLSSNALDKLIRVYGRIKKYDDIGIAIERSLAAARKKERTAAVVRAIATFEQRKQRHAKRQMLPKKNPQCV